MTERPTHQTQSITITFPEIRLARRNAHQLRGYFGNLFKEHSELLHNHFADGGLRYGYPLVQYKIVGGVPTLLGFEEGGKLLTELFLQIKNLDIEGRSYPVFAKNIVAKTGTIGLSDQLHFYDFDSLWMALNQENYERYLNYSEEARRAQLQSIAVNNIRALFTALGLNLLREQEIKVALNVEERFTHFKNQKMLAFTGQLVTNALLPDLAGLGKSVSRGFGVVRVKS
ncbi:MAG: CRISPR-associated endonuclease Cas6 [Saprospiraceae bacterium]|nr:CRISPR-associated endonuclease Cas6 [Saprospiraceae bacterium]